MEIHQDHKRRRQLIQAKFREIFGSAPSVWVQAPGRVDLMGSHTDYNEGFVLTQAIDRNTWLAARPRSDRLVRVASLDADGHSQFSLENIDHDKSVPWSNYVRGVAWALRSQGYTLQGFDGLIQSTVPFGSGLSSSAALEVGVAVLFDRLSGLRLDKVEMALLSQRAENEFVGLNCGILDQYSSLMGELGRVILLDCRELSSKTVPFARDIALVICDTRSKRELTGSEYSDRREQCEEGVRILSKAHPDIKALRDVSLAQLEMSEDDLPQVVAKRCRFVIEENRRVLAMAEAIGRGDEDWIQKLASASYMGARDLYEIVSLEMEQMTAAMLTHPGVIGTRQAGAGFGGCMVAFVKGDQVDDFSEHVRHRYYTESGIGPEVYPVQAAAGAGVLEG